MADFSLQRFNAGGIPDAEGRDPAARPEPATSASQTPDLQPGQNELSSALRRLAGIRKKLERSSDKPAGRPLRAVRLRPIQPKLSAEISDASQTESPVQQTTDGGVQSSAAIIPPRLSLRFHPQPEPLATTADMTMSSVDVSSVQTGVVNTMAIDLPLYCWPNPAGKMRYRPVERVPLRFMDSVRRKDPGNVYFQRTGQPYMAAYDSIVTAVISVPGGLADCICDIHTHPVGYDHRHSRTFIHLLEKSSPTSFILVGSIPQHCGSPHYSDVNALALRMTNAARMDIRIAKVFMALYTDYKEARKRGNRADEEKNLCWLARTDLSFTGLNPSKPGTVDYMKKTLLHNPGVFVSAGELTGDKEMVKQQLGPDAFSFGDAEPRKLLAFAQECGLLMLIHNDWGDHGLHSEDMRPEAVKTAYENFERLIETMAGYPDANIILAHCGIGRFVRPDAEVVDVDVPAVMGMRAGRPVMLMPTKRLKVPKHIALMYRAVERAPHVKFDISWNDVGEAFVTDPALRDALVEFIIRNQDRVLFGSDTVKPVNQGQYNQALTLVSPIIAEVARRDKEAAWKLVRGNYEAIILKAGSKVQEWTERELRAQLRDANLSPLAHSRIRARLTSMDNMLMERAPKRQEISAEARRKFDAWYGELMKGVVQRPHRLRQFRPARLVPAPETAYEQVYRTLPGPEVQTWREHDNDEYGHGTPHGKFYNPKAIATAAAIGGGLGVAAFAGVAEVAGTANDAIQHGGSPLIAEDFHLVNPTAFIIRALFVVLKTTYGEGLRLKWEQIFEQGHVTSKDLNVYMDRLASLGPSFGIPADRIDKAAMLTEQFRANMQRLYDTPLSAFATIASDPKQGVTEEDRRKRKFDVIMAEVGRYQINLDRALGVQASSINALDPRATWGKVYRVGVAASYILNVASNLQFMLAGHHAGGVGGFIEVAVQVLFGIANSAMLLQSVGGIAGGMRKMNLETYGKSPLRWGGSAGNALFTATGVPWTLSEFTPDNLALPENVSSAADLVGHITPAVFKALLDVAFSLGTRRIGSDELRRNLRRRMRSPESQASASYFMAIALILRELMQLKP